MFSIRGGNPMSTSSEGAATPVPQRGSGPGFAILLVLLIAVMAATGYLYSQLNQTRAEIAQMREDITNEISKIHETSAVTTQTTRRSAEALKAELDATRAQATRLVGQAKEEAEKHAEELAANLQKVQQEQVQQAQRVTAVSAEVGQVKDQTVAANTRIGEVSTDVGKVRSDVAATRSELEKTIASLKAAQGDLGVQSGLIATNAKELAALKQLGECNYVEFKLGKTKAPQKVGDIAVLLEKADPKNNRYTIKVIADDKTVQKRDKTVNEPVQFLLSRATQPYELVVNDIKKDLISGYVAAPKVQQTRSN